MKKLKLVLKQKKDVLIIVALSVAAVLLMIFGINAFNTESVPEVIVEAATQTPTTLAPAATQPSAAPAETKPAETTPSQLKPEETTTTAPTDEVEEILKAVTDGVNSLKSPESSFRGHKVQDINIKLVDSSVPSMNNVINGVISLFAKEETYDYDFTNGVASDPENGGTSESNDIFPPGDKPFDLTREGVASATKTADGENTVYTVVIVAETSTLENPRPPHHNAGADTLDLSSVEIPIVTLTRVDFEYPGAEISVTVNPQGQVIRYSEHLAISGTGEGHGLGITGYGTIEGYMDEKWDIEWK